MTNWKLAFTSVLIVVGCVAAGNAQSVRAKTGLTPASRPQRVGFDPARLARIDHAVRAAVDAGRFPGMVTLLARHGRIVSFNVYGQADIASAKPLSKDAIFRIYSMTKPITGVAMMMLFEEGKWRLDDPVTKFIPEFRNLRVLKGVDAGGQPILEDINRPPTMRELMSHTAGFGYGLGVANPVDRLYVEKRVLGAAGLTQMIERTAEIPLKFQPGTNWAYSSAADIQGYLVEKLSGMRFGEFLSSRIFKPLRMSDTGFFLTPQQKTRLASLYRAGPDGKLIAVNTALGYPLPDPTQPPALESGGGGLYSTAIDYARFCQMLLNGGELDGARILAPATIELMDTNVVPEAVINTPDPTRVANLRPGVGFGMDVLIETDPRRIGSLLGKGTMSWGGLAGTFFWVDPTNDLFFVGMTQRILDPTGSEMGTTMRTLTYQALTAPQN